MRDCTRSSEIMRNKDWDRRWPGRCYFYPGRDCPGWEPGGACGRIGKVIGSQTDWTLETEITGMDWWLIFHLARERRFVAFLEGSSGR